ncbi:MAG: hypothetical protein KKH98_12220 [Spirochaetes bacterium]|nr:hypothetical protein [Spirochaetota bacterium]
MKRFLCIQAVLFLILLVSLPLSGKVYDYEEEVMTYYTVLKKHDMPSLMRVVEESKKEMKIAAIRRLGEKKDKTATDLLTAIMIYSWNPKMYIDKFKKKKGIAPGFDEDIRSEAAIMLGKVNKTESIVFFGTTLLSDKDKRVKECCLRSLGSYKKEESVQQIEKYVDFQLQQEKPSVEDDLILIATQQLGEVGHKSAFLILSDISQSKKLSNSTRMAALDALKKLNWD